MDNPYQQKKLSELTIGQKCTTGVPHMVAYFNMEIIQRNKNGTIKVRYFTKDGIKYKDFNLPASIKVWIIK